MCVCVCVKTRRKGKGNCRLCVSVCPPQQDTFRRYSGSNLANADSQSPFPYAGRACVQT